MVYFLLFGYVCMCAFPIVIFAIEKEKKEMKVSNMNLDEFLKWEKTGFFP